MMSDDRNDPFGDEEFSSRGGHDHVEPAPAAAGRGKRRGWKIAIIILLIMLLMIVLCCGGGFWSIYSGAESTTDEAAIRAWTGEMLSIEIPEDYVPLSGNTIPVFGVMDFRIVSYRGPDESELHLLEMTGSAARDPQAHAQLDSSFRNMLAQQAEAIQEKSVEIREVEIDGTTLDFKLVTGPGAQSGKELRELRGIVPTDRGAVMIVFQAPKESFDEAAAMAVLGTIGE